MDAAVWAWTGLDWLGLAWTGLDWLGLAWTGLDWLARRKRRTRQEQPSRLAHGSAGGIPRWWYVGRQLVGAAWPWLGDALSVTTHYYDYRLQAPAGPTTTDTLGAASHVAASSPFHLSTLSLVPDAA
jgi:hypothetical protein